METRHSRAPALCGWLQDCRWGRFSGQEEEEPSPGVQRRQAGPVATAGREDPHRGKHRWGVGSGLRLRLGLVVAREVEEGHKHVWQ